MAQLVFIVSRHRPKLREYLQREFAEQAEVTVIVDRRIGDRRVGGAARTPDRRRNSRRQGAIDDRLRSLGWAIVWRDDTTTVCVESEEASA
jgi:hypothetical protein